MQSVLIIAAIRNRNAFQHCSIVDKIGMDVDALSFKPSLSLLQYETDILGFINFCLRKKDSALSGPSRQLVNLELSHI